MRQINGIEVLSLSQYKELIQVAGLGKPIRSKKSVYERVNEKIIKIIEDSGSDERP